MNEFLGPLGWRQTDRKYEDLTSTGETRNSVDSDDDSISNSPDPVRSSDLP